MSRVIKFRAWIKRDEQMFYQNNQYLQSFLRRCNQLATNYEYTHDKYAENKYELMQFTGLLDKNGKEIYEGDIISDEDYPFVGIVEFVESSFMVMEQGKHEENFLSSYDHKPIVIGNIYENPELLESK